MRQIYLILCLFGCLLSACGGGGSSAPASSLSASGNVTPPASLPSTKVTVSGNVSYDFIPHDPISFGLDYTAISTKAVTSMRVDLLGEGDQILETSMTDAEGYYRFELDQDQSVKVRVSASLSVDNGKSWSFTVRDNLAEGKVYRLESDWVTATSDMTLDLHAASGWSAQGYSASRQAAPFAILDTLQLATTKLIATDAEISFPNLDVFWSVENKTTLGQRDVGHIGATQYVSSDQPAIFVLGEADKNTDEYDQHVILHEFGHYFEDQFSRYDSIGGVHAFDEKLDPRVAFSEGFSHAFAAMILGDPIYRDSKGHAQQSGFGVDLENDLTAQTGWFNEVTIASIIYDVFDEHPDYGDHISGGFDAIYKTMTSEAFMSSNFFSTIYSFSEALTTVTDVDPIDLNILLTDRAITGFGEAGQGERNDGGISSSLPVYKVLSVDQPSAQICSVSGAGNFNKLGNREYIRLDIPRRDTYSLTVTSIEGQQERDPDFLIWQSDDLIAKVETVQSDADRFTGALEAGVYILEAYDFFNVNGLASQRRDSCFDFTLT